MGHALADVGGDASLLSVMQATSAAGHAAAVAFSRVHHAFTRLCLKRWLIVLI